MANVAFAPPSNDKLDILGRLLKVWNAYPGKTIEQLITIPFAESSSYDLSNQQWIELIEKYYRDMP